MDIGEDVMMIEGNEIVYDVENIEELDHFDIGEEGCSDPEEVPANEIGMWSEEGERIPLSRQKTRRGIKKKVGRKTCASLIQIPRRQPPRAARNKSFQHYGTLEEDDDEESCEEVLMGGDDGDDDGDEAEGTTSQTWRIFVRKDGSGMHFNCPIFMDSAMNINTVVSIIASNTSGLTVPETMICDSIPQEYTNTGSFVVRLEEGVDRETICNDGLGRWLQAQMFVRKYQVERNTRKPKATNNNDHNLKIVCEQFLHPGTDNRGDFIRKIYTGFNNDEHMMPFVVICYEWMGQPHPLTVYEEDDDIGDKTFEQNTWKKCANNDEQVPILAKSGCDFNTAISILLSTERFTACGKSVPMYVQESISFVLDLNACGGERALYMDGNEWLRPSSRSRYYRITNEMTDDLSSWKFARTTTNDYDIQALSRRYAGRKFTESCGFVRRIFLIRFLDSCPEYVVSQLVNSHLAIVSYEWKDAPLQRFIEPSVAENQDLIVGEEAVLVQNGDMIEGEEFVELESSLDKKKKENNERLIEMMQRLQRLDVYIKKNGFHENSEEVRIVTDLGLMLDTLFP